MDALRQAVQQTQQTAALAMTQRGEDHIRMNLQDTRIEGLGCQLDAMGDRMLEMQATVLQLRGGTARVP